MRFSVLASGSRANSTFLEVESKRLLIDCGLSAKQTEIRLRSLGIDPATIDAILLTHEHSDHLNGVSVLSRRHEIPVYGNGATIERAGEVHSWEIFETGKVFSLSEIEVHPVRIVHDAEDPVGFVLKSNRYRFGHFTDLGKVTPLVRDAAMLCDAMVLEANHDEELLDLCEYPWQVKQRIASMHGHLSNTESVEFLKDIWHPGLKHIVLGHLSENSNTPDRALSSFAEEFNLDDFETFLCAGKQEATPLIDLSSGPQQLVAAF